eukprot:jgi/Chrzof1/10657/Cz05g07070.t1
MLKSAAVPSKLNIATTAEHQCSYTSAADKHPTDSTRPHGQVKRQGSIWHCQQGSWVKIRNCQVSNSSIWICQHQQTCSRDI